MADSSVNIRIGATGGDAAAGELKKVNAAFEQTKEVHGDIKQKFAEKFEHVGVHIFGSQLLEMNGIAGHTRPIIGAMSMAVNELAATFGVATGGIYFVVMALAALAAIAYKVVEGHDKQAEAIKKQNEELGKLAKTLTDYYDTQEKVSAQGRAVAAVALDDVRTKQRELNEEITKGEGILNGQAEAFRQSEVRGSLAKQALEGWSLIYHKVKGDSADVAAALERDNVVVRKNLIVHRAELEKLGEEYKKLDGIIHGHTKANEESAKKAAEAADKELEAVGKSVEQMSKIQLKAEGEVMAANESGVNHKLANIHKTHDMELASLNKLNDERIKSIEKNVKDEQRAAGMRQQVWAQHAATRAALEKAEQAKQKAAWAEYFGAVQTMDSATTALGKTAFASFASTVGTSMASMVVDGKNFFESFEAGMKNLVKAFIAQVTEMMIKWAAFKMMTGGMGGGMMGGGGGGGMPMPGMFASGFEGVVQGPTTFMAGEAGMERVSITPLNASYGNAPTGGKGGGGGVNIGSVNTTVNGVQDAKAIADQVGQQIIRRIRGMGELNFARTS